MRSYPVHLFVLLLVTSIIIVFYADSVTLAQETPDPSDTPIPPVTVTPDMTALVVSLPFSDSFDTEDVTERWIAGGDRLLDTEEGYKYWGWRYDPEDGYLDGGWVLNGSQAETLSTLEYASFLDLSGILNAQLMFRQKGSLPDSDLIAVDLSLDGGVTWFTVDIQIELETINEAVDETVDQPASAKPENGWVQRTVDLSDYRNQVVRLRFRVQTGMRLPEKDGSTAFYQIDNLSIQYIAPELPLVLEPVFPGPRTLMGLHLVVGAHEEPVLALVENLRNAGVPLGTIKGTSSTETLLNKVAEISPETIIVYRSLETPRGMIDCPNEFEDPVIEAHAWMNGLWPEWEGVNADYYEIMNECLPALDWLVPFSIEAMRLAGEREYCLLIFSFAGGAPEPDQYGQLLPAYEYAVQNPCRPGWRHGIALHAYSGDPQRLLSESGPWLGLRYRKYYQQIFPELPEAGYLPLFLTEAGPGDGSTQFSCEDVTRDVIQYTQQIESDPYVAGFHLWNLGLPDLVWADVTECLPMLGDALVGYYSSR